MSDSYNERLRIDASVESNEETPNSVGANRPAPVKRGQKSPRNYDLFLRRAWAQKKKEMAASVERSRKVPLLQIVFTVAESQSLGPNVHGAGPIVIVDQKRVPTELDDLWTDDAISDVTAEFEYNVRLAVLGDDQFREFQTFYCDGSVHHRATVERTSDHQSLVSYYAHAPSPKLRRKLVQQFQARRRAARFAAEHPRIE